MKPIELKDEETKVEELIMRTEIPNSPFQVISVKGGKHFAVLGKYRLTKEHETKEAAIKDAEEINWDNITRLLLLINEIQKEKNL